MQSSSVVKYGSVVPLDIFLSRNPDLKDCYLTLDYCLLLKNDNPKLIFIGSDIKTEEEKYIRRKVNKLIIDKNIADYPPETRFFFSRGLRFNTLEKIKL